MRENERPASHANVSPQPTQCLFRLTHYLSSDIGCLFLPKVPIGG